MGRNSRGRGHSSSARGGRGQHGSSSRIKKSISPNPRRPAIPRAAVDSTKLATHLTVPTRSPIRTRGLLAQEGGPSTSSSGTARPIPTSNNFVLLSDDNGCDDDDEERGADGVVTNTSSNTTKGISTAGGNLERRAIKKMPPITIPEYPAANIDQVLADANCEYLIRMNKMSVKVVTSDQTQFDKVLAALKKANIQYFTYDSPDKLPVKIVLSGFNIQVTQTQLIDEILAQKKVAPREAKVLSTKTTVTGDQILYLLYFERGSVKIQDLRKIKSLNGLIVSWRYFSKRPSDAAQCHRCQRFGHGSRNCTLAPKCVKCGAAHLTGECTLPRKANLGADKNAEKQKVKCANCNGNHTANYRGCTARKTYLESLEKQRKKPATREPPRTAAGSSSNANPPGFGRTYANVAANAAGSNSDGTGDGDLFTLTEFLSLARDMFTRLNGCRNKLEQFFALHQLMGTYLCPA